MKEEIKEIKKLCSDMEEHLEKGFTLNLYRDDFNEDSIWGDICDVLQEDRGCSAIELKVLSVSCSYDDE